MDMLGLRHVVIEEQDAFASRKFLLSRTLQLEIKELENLRYGGARNRERCGHKYA